jgi:hypothetical protein
MTSTYAFDNSWRKAHQRLRSIEAMADPGSIRHLDATGIGAVSKSGPVRARSPAG